MRNAGKKESPVAAAAEQAGRSSLGRAGFHEMLRRMLRIRLFDEAAALVQSASIPGMLHNSTGQEGEIVGACMALRDQDYITGNHRSHGHPIGKGAALGPLMAELFGKRTGVCGGKGGSMHLAVFSVGSLGESGIVGAAMPAAVGAALSARLRGSGQVCLCFFGDGGANCGPFHESLNLAAVWRLPVVFLCENNGYAICSLQAQTTAVTDIAVRAGSYAMPGEVVDGQDALIVYDAVSAAVARARSGGGPSLIEAKTYRFCEHVEGQPLPQYRSEKEISAWRERDPIDILVSQLRTGRQLNPDELASIRSEVEAEVAAAVDFAHQSPAPRPEDLFSDVFA
jgi:pyruvate dehydrogenase E1 component alpha subunit